MQRALTVMSLLYPLALAFLALIPLIILLYILKLKRKEKVISATLLWRKTIDDVRVNAPFQRLRRNLLLLLQIIVIALLALALTRPFMELGGTSGRNLIVMIDHSASMRATDRKPSRLAWAKDQALSLVKDLSSSDRMMVISFHEQTVIRASLTSDQQKLKQAIEAIEPSNRGTRIREAWYTAMSVAKQHPQTEVFVLSDGRCEDLDALPHEGIDVRFVQAAVESNNIAITSLGTRKYPDPDRPVEIYAELHNYRTEAADVMLEIFIDDKLVDVRKVSMGAGKSSAQVIQRPAGQRGLVRLRVDVPDDLDLDNQAWAVLETPEPLKVLLVSDNDYWLTQALGSDPLVEASALPRSQFKSDPKSMKAYDVVILDQVALAQPLPGNYLIFGTPPELTGWKRTGEHTPMAIIDWDRKHPVNRYLTYSNVNVSRSLAVTPPSWMKPILESDRGTLIYAGEEKGIKMVYVAFDVLDSDWPLRVSFPIFVPNALRWLKKIDAEGLGETSLRVGQTLSALIPPDVKEVSIVDPEGKSHTVTVGGNPEIHFTRTESLGVYRVKRSEKSDLRYVVNFTNGQESDIAPRDTVKVGEVPVKAQKDVRSSHREVWWPIALAAFAFLMLEWFVYTRRVGL